MTRPRPARVAPILERMPLPDAESDAVLVERLRAGEDGALEIVFRRYASELLRLASGLTATTADAEDVVQDVFVGLRLALRRYEDRGMFRSWLRAVTVNTALAARRRQTVRREAPLEPTLSEQTRDQHEELALRDALAQLPEPLRDVFVLKMVEGYSHAEIGELLGIRSGTSEVRLFRAVRRLRDLLKEQD